MQFLIDHDLHCHTQLSACSADTQMTVEAIVQHARQHGYRTQCITDHLWDSSVPGASDWYAPQTIAHVRQSLPLPTPQGLRVVFGCEAEFTGGKTLSLAEAHCDEFDFIAIAPNHFHMRNFVRPSHYDTAQKLATLLVERLEQIAALPLPFEKVGIAHINGRTVFMEGDPAEVFMAVEEGRYRAVMRKFAALGAGIEINLASFSEGWQEKEDAMLRLHRMAMEEGCKFYLASDAHHVQDLQRVVRNAPAVLALLGLQEDQKYHIPE